MSDTIPLDLQKQAEASPSPPADQMQALKSQNEERAKETAPTEDQARSAAFYNGYMDKLKRVVVIPALDHLIETNKAALEKLSAVHPELYARLISAEAELRQEIERMDAEAADE